MNHASIPRPHRSSQIGSTARRRCSRFIFVRRDRNYRSDSLSGLDSMTWRRWPVAEQIPPTRSLSEIENDLFAEVADRTPFTNFNIGAGIRHLLEILAKAIYDLYGLLAT